MQCPTRCPRFALRCQEHKGYEPVVLLLDENTERLGLCGCCNLLAREFRVVLLVEG